MDKTPLVIGIDLGSADSYVGYVSKGVIDVVQNEVSQRKTPSLVGFTERERLLGDQALSQIKSNVRNTCRNFKHLLGQKADSPSTEAERFWSTCDLATDDRGYTACTVNYKGEQKTFSAVAVTAMFLTKIKDITEAWCDGVVEEAVIGVPSFFNDFQRTALLDAARIAGLKVLRLMNEHTATALEYGYFRTKEFDAGKPHTVAFCHMGHTTFSVAVVQFVRGKLTILCERSAKVGGRDMDECLIRTFAEQFKKKSGCDVLSNKRALFKLEDAVTKTKKILSANTESSISCECLMEDMDFSSRIDRADFLEMCKPMMAKVSDVLEGARVACGLPVAAIDAVEMVGGASRVPWVKEMCSKAFGGRELSMTMNADECVARGCAIQAAALSKLYKARDFKVEDTSPFPVSLGWRTLPASPSPNSNNGSVDGSATVAPGERSMMIFPPNSLMNLTKVMTFFRDGPFEITAAYGEGEGLPPGTPSHLGSYKIELPQLPERRKVKVRATLTLHGTFHLASAHLIEEEEVNAEEDGAEDGGMPNGNCPGTPDDGEEPLARSSSSRQVPASEDGADDPAGFGKRRAPSQAGPARKRRYRRTDLAVTPLGLPGLPEAELQRQRAQEEQMVAEMREIVETNARRNDLESYILTMRSGIDAGGKYAAFIADSDRGKFAGQLAKAEDWLYEHHEEPKQVFVDKLAELKVLGGPVEVRQREEEKRREAVSSFEQSVRTLITAAQQQAAKPKLPADLAQIRSLESACFDAMRWLSGLQARQAKLARHEDPAFTSAALEARREELSRLADSALEGRENNDSADPVVPASPMSMDNGGGRSRAMDVD